METKLDFDDVLIVPKSSTTASRSAVKLEREFKFYNSTSTWTGIPIMSSNMDTTGSFKMGLALSEYKMITCLHKHYSVEELVDFFCKYSHLTDYIWYSMGVTDNDIQKLKDVYDGLHQKNAWISLNICIDVANGYTNYFTNKVSEIRSLVGEHSIVMAGNICTYDRVHVLIDAGADIVKCGIGSGYACETRRVTGVGYPQLSAVMECADAAHGKKTAEKRLGLVCSDGGCRTPGDICKAFGIGNSDFAMLGGFLSGTEQCEGHWITEGGIQYSYVDENDNIAGSGPFVEGGHLGYGVGGYVSICTHDKNKDGKWKVEPHKKSLQFYGMSSYVAQEKYGGIKDYTASEGSVQNVPYKGDVSIVLKEIMGGLRSCCAYIGATCLKDMAKCTSYIRVNRVHS